MFKKYFIIVLALAIIIYGVISINIYNTIALSPIGNTDDNFKKVSSEFGEDFSEFIKDKSPMKIYLGEANDNDAIVNFYGKQIKLTKDNPFLKGVKPLINYTKNTFYSIMDKINKNTENINDDTSNTSNDKSKISDDKSKISDDESNVNNNDKTDLQNIVNEFIETQDKSSN